MRYHAESQTLYEVAVTPLSEPRLQELAALKGRLVEGDFVAQVAVVFVSEDLALAHLQSVRQLGLELRYVGPQGEAVLNVGTRVGAGTGPEGVLLPVLREEAWPHVAGTAHRRLLAGPAGPWVTFGHDTPKQLARVGIAELERRSLADFEAEALRNLAAREPQVVEQAGIVELRDEYAPEMMLLPARMRDIAARLRSEMFVVSVPQEGSLLAVPLTGNVTALCTLARQKFEASKHRRISPLPIIIGMDGRPVGFASPEAPAASAHGSEVTVIGGDAPQGWAPAASPTIEAPEVEVPKKPWWRFW
ncbi:MAG: hypothetical protein V4850_05740 [Myxococcota bacterium]